MVYCISIISPWFPPLPFLHVGDKKGTHPVLIKLACVGSLCCVSVGMRFVHQLSPVAVLNLLFLASVSSADNTRCLISPLHLWFGREKPDDRICSPLILPGLNQICANSWGICSLNLSSSITVFCFSPLYLTFSFLFPFLSTLHLSSLLLLTASWECSVWQLDCRCGVQVGVVNSVWWLLIDAAPLLWSHMMT